MHHFNTNADLNNITTDVFPLYGTAAASITSDLNNKVSFNYSESKTFNLTIRQNTFIRILKSVFPNTISNVYRKSSSELHIVFLTKEPLYVYMDATYRSDHNNFKVWALSDDLDVLDKFIQKITTMTNEHKLDYETNDIRWYYKTSNGIDWNNFEEKAIKAICQKAYPYINNIEQFVDNYINSEESVLILIGPPGTGKTSLIRYIISRYNTLRKNNMLNISNHRNHVYYSSDKDVLEADEMFISFAMQPNAMMVLEDIDVHLSSRSDGNTFMYKLLGSSDGLIKNTNRKIVISTNLPNVKDIDDALVRDGRCFATVEFKKLTYEQSVDFLQDVSPTNYNKLLESGKKSSYTLAQLYSGKFNDEAKK